VPQDDGKNSLPSVMIDLDQPTQIARHPWWARHRRFGNAGVLAAMACAVALVGAVGGAGAWYAWTSSHADSPASKPVNTISVFAELPTEPDFSENEVATGFAGHVSVINTEPRTVRIDSLQAHESGLTLSSLPLSRNAPRYDVPPSGAISIAVTLSLQCASKTLPSGISLSLDAYALEGDDVTGVPQSALLSILPWRDTIMLFCPMH
jgi:hypothetical protein